MTDDSPNDPFTLALVTEELDTDEKLAGGM